MTLNGGVNRSLVKDTIPDEAINGWIDLRQERRHLRRVLLMAFRHRGGDHVTLGIHPNMQFLPAPGLLLAVFLAMPFALSTDLSPRTVDNQADRSLWAMIDLTSDDHRSMAPGQCRMVGTRKRQLHQLQNRAKKAFGLAQRQVTEQTERKRGLDGDIGIDGLGASLTGHWRSPGCNRLWTDPQGDVTAIA
jgi:hypothetical protein